MSEQTSSRTEEEPISFADFLQSSPPSVRRVVLDLFMIDKDGVISLSKPSLLLNCPREQCNGERIFRPFDIESTSYKLQVSVNKYVNYLCSNCQAYMKTYSISVRFSGTDVAGDCYKFGERPPFGPPTPSRLISLTGPDRETFLKGRRCESQGLGVGAFVYYRRVVENQKDRILDEIIKVADKVGADTGVIKTLNAAKSETQFSKALGSVEVPQSLLISGQNPLSLLHAALSEGLHAQTDEECLGLANSVRVVLTELSERIGQALKDEAEIRHAVSMLMAKRDTKS